LRIVTEVTAPGPRRPLSTLLWLGLITLLGLPLISPLWRWSAVPCTHDGHLHYHRIAALRHAWENGVFFSRWLPDVAFGYGYPFFVFREAPPLYLPLLPHLLGLPLPAASNLFYALTILAAGWFMFLWVRDVFGERAAVVSAVAYMAAPYVLVDALIRGNSPESLALPLFPLVLWAGRRWVLAGSWGSFLAGVGGLALLALSHNISVLIFVPTLLVYLLGVILATGDGRGIRWTAVRGPLYRLVILLVLGLGLSLFYTGGALAELNLVTLEQSTTTRNNDWRFNFGTVAEIFAPVAPEDPALVNPPLLLRLGWVPVALALLGTTGLAWIRGADRRAREQRAHIIMMIAAAAVFLFMALPLSRAVWDNLPLIEFVQFPWRFVGRAALPVAFLAGVVFAHPVFAGGAGWRRWAWLAIPAAVALLILEAVPALYPRMCREEPFPTIVTVHDYERATGLVGVDPEGSYFPRTVRERPTGSPLEADYRAGRPPERFDATVLPPGVTLDAAYDGLAATARVTSPEAFTARYLSFDYPGWQVTIDGRPVATVPEDPSGLITFPVPAGTHDIRVDWTMTPLRLILSSLSVMALVLSGVALVTLWIQPQRTPLPGASPARAPDGRLLLALALLGVGLLGFKLLVVDRMETPLRRTAAPPVAQPAALTGGALRLDGFNLSRETVPAGETFDIDMAWTAVAPPQVDYQTNVWLVGPEGLVWSDKGTERPRLYEDAPPTRLWAAGEWGWDSREVRVLPGTPPGDYDLVLTLFDKATLQPVTLTGPDGAVVGPTAVIGQIDVAAGTGQGSNAIAPQFPLSAEVPALGLRLLGYNQDRATAAPGESVLLTLFWERLGEDPAAEVGVLLQDATGAAAHAWTLPISRADYPPSVWGDGPVRGQHLLPLPAALPGGDYRLAIDGGPALGELRLDAPDRTTVVPPLQQTIGATFSLPDGGPAATLVGLAQQSGVGPPCTAMPPPGGSCALILVWQAEATLPESYHVFLHLVDAAGNLIAQTDGVPAAWTRPTTGWLPGEIIADTHSLPLPGELPDGPLSLRIGLYDPDTGQRLSTAEGDAITLPLDR
jgi:hypothetical protein